MQNENEKNSINEYEKILNRQNEVIAELKEKMINFQEIINAKDIALNNTNKKLVFIYEKYNQLEQEYKIKMENFKLKMKEKEEDYKEMGNKLMDTFSYLNKLVMISNIDKDNIDEIQDIKPKERSHKNLINVKTYQEEGHKSQEINIKKQTSLVPKKKKRETIKII